MNWLGLGAISAFLAVAFGAFGAHGLAQVLDERALEIFRLGAQYQMYHALALLALGAAPLARRSTAANIAGWAFLAGTVVFSGSLYLLSITGQSWLGAVTPFGGVSFMIGWIALAYAAWSGAKVKS